MRAGLHCFGLQDYMSRIRGGHNFYQIRVNESPLYTFDDTLHLLLAFNKETVDLHWHDLAEGGGILHDTAIKVPGDELADRGVRDFSMPLTKIAEQEGGHKIMMNTAAIGAMAGLTSFPFEWIADVIESNFKRKGARHRQEQPQGRRGRLQGRPGAVRVRVPVEARRPSPAPRAA